MRGHSRQVVRVQKEMASQTLERVEQGREHHAEDEDRLRVALPVLFAAPVGTHQSIEAALGRFSQPNRRPTAKRSRGLGSEIDALWMRPSGREPTEEEKTQLAALRRVASVLGVHFIEVDGDDLVETIKRVAQERGSTYIFVGHSR